MVEYWLLPPSDWSYRPVSPNPSTAGALAALVVEDDASFRESLGFTLGRLGFEVQMAQDGVEALASFQAGRERISLVVLDLAMPRMDGRQTFHSLRKLSPNLPVIISSAEEGERAADLVQGPGPAAFLQKPYDLDQLRAAVEEVLPGLLPEPN